MLKFQKLPKFPKTSKFAKILTFWQFSANFVFSELVPKRLLLRIILLNLAEHSIEKNKILYAKRGRKNAMNLIKKSHSVARKLTEDKK